MDDMQRLKLFERYPGLAWSWVAVVVLLVDQLSKAYVVHTLALYESKAWLPFLSFTLVHNHGVAFGQLGASSVWHVWGLVAVASAIIAYLAWMLIRVSRDERAMGMALSMILGGAIGNVIDRLFYGYVIDFIDFYIGSWHWYVFNLADSAICVGVVILLGLLCWGEGIQAEAGD
jgi:signal peptidase II